MIVVADASPLVFLGKIGCLHMVEELAGKEILIPAQIRDEILSPGNDRNEMEMLRRFLKRHCVETVKHPRRFASAMSTADNAALSLAIQRGADILLCDDRILRSMAQLEGIRPLGTLGVLLRAYRAGMNDAQQTRRYVDTLVAQHGFRIGIETYQEVLAAILECRS